MSVRLARFAPALLVAAACAGCSSWGVHDAPALAGYRTASAKCAVVSLSVRDDADVLRRAAGIGLSSAIEADLTAMLAFTEAQLAQQFSVRPTADFVAQEDFRSVATATFELHQPKIEGAALPVFARDRLALAEAELTSDAAQRLCAALQVELVAVTHAVWGTHTERDSPVTRARVQSVLGVYDRTGARLYAGRRETLSEDKVGVFNVDEIDERTLQRWVEAYEQGVKEMVESL